ncbi:hypothetical protein DRO60_02360 [Candidatus Bathyarchaeota archaeon]|nr:MAG: hypothetical protein DRO60_02360 [Candidatus Bathyarchaeota archaeon]
MRASRAYAPIFSYGDWEIEVLDEDMVKLTLRRVKPPVRMVWYADHTIKIYELAHYLDALDAVLADGELLLGVNDTLCELVRTDGEWRLGARGAFNFELVGLDTQQALRLALILLYAKAEDPMRDDMARAVSLMGLFPLLESVSEVRLSRPSLEAILSWRDERLVLRAVKASSMSELTTLLSLAEAGVLEEPEVEIEAEDVEEFQELLASLLLGELSTRFLDEDALTPVRRELAKLVVKHVPHEGRVHISKDEVIVENSYGTWEIDLEDGDLHLNDEYICAEVEIPGLGVIYLPGVGELRLGRVSLKLVAALMVALRPEDVKDRSLRRQIEKAAPAGAH